MLPCTRPPARPEREPQNQGKTTEKPRKNKEIQTSHKTPCRRNPCRSGVAALARRPRGGLANRREGGVYRSCAPQGSCRKAGFTAERLCLQHKGWIYRRKAGLSQLCPATLLQKGWIYRRKAGFIAAMPRTAFAERQDLSQKGWIYTRKAGFIAAMPRKAFAERLDLSQKGWVYRSYAQQGPCRKAELGVPCLAFHIDRKLGNW